MREDHTAYETALSALNEYIASHAMRHTPEREMLLEKVCAFHQPFTAEQLCTVSRELHISTGTVYNALSLFVLAGILHVNKREYGQVASEYQLMIPRRSYTQLICTKCGRVAEFHDKALERLIQTRKYSNFTLRNYGLNVYGECKVCRRSKTSRKKEKA